MTTRDLRSSSEGNLDHDVTDRSLLSVWSSHLFPRDRSWDQPPSVRGRYDDLNIRRVREPGRSPNPTTHDGREDEKERPTKRGPTPWTKGATVPSSRLGSSHPELVERVGSYKRGPCLSASSEGTPTTSDSHPPGSDTRSGDTIRKLYCPPQLIRGSMTP